MDAEDAVDAVSGAGGRSGRGRRGRSGVLKARGRGTCICPRITAPASSCSMVFLSARYAFLIVSNSILGLVFSAYVVSGRVSTLMTAGYPARERIFPLRAELLNGVPILQLPRLLLEGAFHERGLPHCEL